MTSFFFQEDSTQVQCACNTVQLSEKCEFRVSPFCQVVEIKAQVIWVPTLSVTVLPKIQRYQNPFMCVKVIASQS